ncbi:hypothetical protein L7F22_044479 [Adiantum nelumboides]|nr:hypothetical protein [Adiantum nelumboides]
MADNNKENRMSIDDFDFAHEDANDDTSMLVNYLVTRLHQAMGNPALQGKVQQQLHAYGILPPIQQERGPERFQGETSKRGLSMEKGVENPYQELKQLLEGKPSSKKKGHAQPERSPSREREESESSDESMEDVAPRRRRAQRSPTPTNRKRSPHSPHRRESKREEKNSKKKKERKRSPSSPSSSPSSSLDEGSGYSSQERQRRGHRRSYAAWKRSSKLKKFKEGGKNISFLTYDGTFGATDKVLAFIQQFDAAFGDEGFTESSKLRHVAMHFQKSARQWWASLWANGEAPKTWKTLRASIMKQFLASDAKDKVLTKWRSLKLSPYESIHKYVDKFWDLLLKATVYKKIDFEEQKQQSAQKLHLQSTDAYSLGASPKTSSFSWDNKSSPHKNSIKRRRCASMATLCDKEGSDDGQHNRLQANASPNIVSLFPDPSSKDHLSIDDITEKEYSNKGSCNISENLPSNTIPLLGLIEEENSQILTETSRQSNWMQATFNGVNVMVGVGLLSCPYAVKEGGWGGLIVLVLFAIVSCYTSHLLRRCMDNRPIGVLASYPDIGQLALGKMGRTIVSIVLYAELYVNSSTNSAYGVEFLILEGDNLSKLFPNYRLTMAGMDINSHAIFAIYATMVILPTVWLENLNWLSVLSFMGVLTTSLVMVLVVWVGAVDGVGFTKTTSIVNWRDLPLAVGVYCFCYSGHVVCPNIYYSMKDKSRYTLVLLIIFTLCFLSYATMSLIGFSMFGDETLSQITLNLPKTNKATYIALFLTVSSFYKF